MFSAVCALTVSVALGGGPVYYGDGQPVGPDGSMVADFSAGPDGNGFGEGEQVYPYSAPMPWLHGYVKEIPAYGGFAVFRPYNYKHVLSQSQTAGGWGMSPTMPYSQQYWHQYQPQAAMSTAQLEQLGSAEYAAEMARLKAREDYRTAGYRPVPPDHQVNPMGYVTPTAATVPAPAPWGPPAAAPARGQAPSHSPKTATPAPRRYTNLLDKLKGAFNR